MHKVAVYAICKNEERFVERALFSVSNADYIVVMDTGSTDNTLNKLNQLKSMLPQLQIHQKEINPWRFDVARNECLKLVPEDADIVVSIDMDEVYPSNWKDLLEEDFDNGYNKITVLKRDLDWQGNIIREGMGNRASCRNAHWEGALHEQLIVDEEEKTFVDNRFMFTHYPDPTKSRDYLSVIENNIDTNKTSDLFFYAWELINAGKWEQGMIIFKSIYNLDSEYTVRKWLVAGGDWLKSQGRLSEAKEWYEKALPVHREGSEWEDQILYPDDVIQQRIAEVSSVKDYKIAVYAICGNEITNIDDWMKSMWEADYICVLDTGSTDGSYEKLLEYQNNNPEKVIVDKKTYNPWRFDTPRNDSLKLVPKDADLCICTDLDERLTATWGDRVRQVWTPECERGYYLYAWSHLEDGSPGRVFWYDKIHKNSGMWQWKFPVHEALYHPVYGHNHLAPNQYCRLPEDFIMLHHYPLPKDGRSNYLPLLEMRAEEYPDDFYGLVYLAHEYKYQQKPEKCIEFVYSKVFPAIAKGNDEMNCKTDLYMFLGDCYDILNQPTEAIASYKAGIEMDPTFRDNYTRLAKVYYKQQQYEEAIKTIQDGMNRSRRQYSWLESDATWSWEMWDVLCLCYWEIQAIDMSYQCALMAYTLDPHNERLKENYLRLQEIVNGAH